MRSDSKDNLGLDIIVSESNQGRCDYDHGKDGKIILQNVKTKHNLL